MGLKWCSVAPYNEDKDFFFLMHIIDFYVFIYLVKDLVQGF